MANVNVNDINGGSRSVTTLDSGWAIKNGIIGGIIGGIVFAILEMMAAWLAQGKPFGPLNMIAGIPLQKPPDQIDQTTGIIVGGISHMVYSMVVGVIVAFIVMSVAALRNSPTATVIFCTVLGFLAWPFNFYIIAPIINAPWFPNSTNPVLQPIWHALFGLALGLYLAAQLPKTTVTVSACTMAQ